MILTEDKLKTRERKEFGIPELKKYPMPDKEHVLAAIRMFNHVDKEHEKELATNIKQKMKKYGIPNDTVGEKNRLYNYINENQYIEDENTICEGGITDYSNIVFLLYEHIQNKPITGILEASNIELLDKMQNQKNISQKAKNILLAKLLQLFFYIAMKKVVEISTKKMAITTMRKTISNEKMYNYFKSHIDEVYAKNPSYRPISKEEYENTNLFQKFAAHFRKRSKDQILTDISKQALDVTLDIHLLPLLATKLAISLPMFVLLFAFNKPIKILLSSIGISLKLGSIDHQIVTFEGKCMHMGLDLSPNGFRIVNVELYSFVGKGDNKKLIMTKIPDPPEELYKPTKSDVLEFLKKYPANTIDGIKTEMRELVNNEG